MSYKENKKAYVIKYKKEKLKRIPLDVQKEKYDEIKAYCDAHHEPINTFIKRVIDEAMKNHP
jgi:hypothetical protein